MLILIDRYRGQLVLVGRGELRVPWILLQACPKRIEPR